MSLNFRKASYENHKLPDSKKKNVEDFKKDIRNFFLLRAYDVVSQGAYRRYLLREKDLQEKWAINMHQSFSRISTEIKQILKYISISKTRGKLNVSTLLQKISVSTDAPELCINEVCRCYLTSVVIFTGVKISGKSDMAPNIVVHRRFEKFCWCFWFLAKVDSVLKLIIKENYTKPENISVTDLIQRIFQDDSLVIQNLTEYCFNALQYVHNSLKVLLDMTPCSEFFV